LADNQNNASNASPSYKVKANGTAIPIEYNLVSLVIFNEINKLASARLIFLDGDASKNDFPLSNKPDFLPGSAIQIEVGYKGQDVIVFKGIVIKSSIKLTNNKTSFLVADCKHDTVKLTKVRKSKIFLQQKDSDIFSTLAQAKSITLDVDDTKVQHEEMVQFNCSDWDFIITRAEANGLLVWADEDKLAIKKPSLASKGVMELKFGNNLLEFDAEMDGRFQFDTVKATGWDPSSQAVKETQGSAPSGLQSQGNVSTSTLSSKTGDADVTMVHGAFVNETELRSWADAQQLKNTLSKIRGRAKCQGSSDLKPGVNVTLAGMGDRFNGTAFISGVRHEINQGNWFTDVEFGLSPKTFIKEHDVNDWPASGIIPAVSGLQVGVVTTLEQDPLSEDRVQVKIPMTDASSDGVWARQAMSDAGNARGCFFRPEVGDEVILGFINDDPRHPVILGMLNSSSFPAVLTPKNTNHEKGIVTREKLKLWFNDEKKIIEIVTPGGNSVTLDDDAKKIILKDQNSNEITMSADGIVIKSSKDIKLDAASGKVSISANELEAKANSSAKVSGASAEVSASGTTTVKGATVQIN
jgi:Rhs element Vgr protein